MICFVVYLDCIVHFYITTIPTEAQALLLKLIRYLDNSQPHWSPVIIPRLCVFRKWRYCDAYVGSSQNMKHRIYKYGWMTERHFVSCLSSKYPILSHKTSQQAHDPRARINCVFLVIPTRMQPTESPGVRSCGRYCSGCSNHHIQRWGNRPGSLCQCSKGLQSLPRNSVYMATHKGHMGGANKVSETLHYRKTYQAAVCSQVVQ